jgi:hypothetical protein
MKNAENTDDESLLQFLSVTFFTLYEIRRYVDEGLWEQAGEENILI